MPIHELMSMYGYPNNTTSETSVQTKKKKKKSSSSKKIKDNKRNVILCLK